MSALWHVRGRAFNWLSAPVNAVWSSSFVISAFPTMLLTARFAALIIVSKTPLRWDPNGALHSFVGCWHFNLIFVQIIFLKSSFSSIFPWTILVLCLKALPVVICFDSPLCKRHWGMNLCPYHILSPNAQLGREGT